MSSKVDAYINKAKKWRDEIEKLRAILLSTKLTEEMKWGKPCYTLDGKNIVIIQDFKEYCAVLFFKGALLKDTDNVLIRQTENMQSARQIRFTGASEITKIKTLLKKYVSEAIEIEKSGLKVVFKRTPEKAPEEFQNKLNKNPALKKAFTALTPGRQRAYILFFSGAKQSTTREARVEKHLKNILKGKGLNE